MRPWLPERRFAWEAATKTQDPSIKNFLANFEHTLTDDEVEMIARQQFDGRGSGRAVKHCRPYWPRPATRG